MNGTTCFIRAPALAFAMIVSQLPERMKRLTQSLACFNSTACGLVTTYQLESLISEQERRCSGNLPDFGEAQSWPELIQFSTVQRARYL